MRVAGFKKLCRCQRCAAKAEQKRTSENVLANAKQTCERFPGFPWVLDESKLVAGKLYNHKTPLPLQCKTCNSPAWHSSSNIRTCISRPGHISCRICKKVKYRRGKVEQQTSGEFTIEGDHTGYKLIHRKCGNYSYSKTVLANRRYTCSFCSGGKPDLRQMRDVAQIRSFFEARTAGELEFHGFDFATRVFTVSCNQHPAQGKYQLSWQSLLTSMNRSSAYGCRNCHNQRMRSMTIIDYNEKIRSLFLAARGQETEKLRLSEKLMHYCLANPRHPPIEASPYEVLFKNKRCPYCFDSSSYHKDYEFIRNYIEMDEDRFLTHSGKKFRLLSSREEIESQIRPFRSISRLMLRVNELTCEFHDSFEISWGAFCYRNMVCTRCSKERNVSYAHAYYQALLEYFDQWYIPEYPVKIKDGSACRVDFKLATKPNYVEIDSALHAGRSWRGTPGVGYMERDRAKDLKLKYNLERIKLYDDQGQVLPISFQLRIIEASFVNRAAHNGLSISARDIEMAKMNINFFRNSRVAGIVKKLLYYHGNHIEFKSKKDVNILTTRNTNDTEFCCTVHQAYFKRNIQSVLKMHFLCPICAGYIRDQKQHSYLLGEQKIAVIREQIKARFGRRFDFERWAEGGEAFFTRTLVFPIRDQFLSKELFVPLPDLLKTPVAKVRKNISIGRYTSCEISPRGERTLYNRHLPVPIASTSAENRILLNKRSTSLLEEYRGNAKRINREMRGLADDDLIDRMITENEDRFKVFFHKTASEARRKLGVFDRKIAPFFARQDVFELLTPREKYACNNQQLLIRDRRCGHSFYVSWYWITAKKNKAKVLLQCQRKECFHRYYLSVNKEPRKIPQKDILKMFRRLFHGQYYPAYPKKKIMVREKMRIVHVPSRRRFWASFDNFKRGKFKCEFKNMKPRELRKLFPRMSQKAS